MPETSQDIANALYPHLRPADRERALANLDRYFDIVLQIFLRQQGAHRPALTASPQVPKLEDERSFL